MKSEPLLEPRALIAPQKRKPQKKSVFFLVFFWMGAPPTKKNTFFPAWVCWDKSQGVYNSGKPPTSVLSAHNETKKSRENAMYYPVSDSDSDPKSGDDPRDPDYTPPGEYITAHCTFWARAGLTLVFRGLYEDRMGGV